MSISFVVDVLILFLLSGTLFMAFRLHRGLKNFRESRSEMEGLVNRLTANVERAEKAIAGLQVAARNSGTDLDKKIKESKFLSDELKFMSEAGNSLADRLEKMAEINRALVEKIEQGGGVGPATAALGGAVSSNIVLPGFMEAQSQIEQKSAQAHPDILSWDDEDEDEEEFWLDDDAGVLQSQAEREFFLALQNSRRKAADGNR